MLCKCYFTLYRTHKHRLVLRVSYYVNIGRVLLLAQFMESEIKQPTV